MSSIKTTQLHDLTRERLVGSRSEHELIGLILSLKDAVLNQRRELARVQLQYDEKKMQYEAVRDKLERVDRACDGQTVAVSQWGVGKGPIVALGNVYSLRDYAEREREHDEKLYRIDVTEVEPEPEQWWYAGHNTLTSLTYVDTVSFRNVPLIHKDGEHLAWRGMARSGNDAKRQAVAAWKQAFGVEVEL